MEGCTNCLGIAEMLRKDKEENSGNLSALRWIVNYREQYEFLEPCINKICLPLILIAGGKYDNTREDNGVSSQ